LTKKKVNDLAYKIIGSAIEVHKELGPGLLESIYEQSMLIELELRGLLTLNQVEIPVKYKGRNLPQKYIMDLLVEDTIIVELKAVSEIHDIHQAQVLTYMKLAKKPKGLIINFNASNIVHSGSISLVNEVFASLPDE
jgi:GxxExxY protein